MNAAENDNDDPIVGFRKANNRLSLNYRQSALNAEGLRIMRMLSDSSNLVTSQADKIKRTILYLYEENVDSNSDDSSAQLNFCRGEEDSNFGISDSSDESSISQFDFIIFLTIFTEEKKRSYCVFIF